jgi:hypothetical protein
LSGSSESASPLLALLAAAGFVVGLAAGGALGAFLASGDTPWLSPTQVNIEQENLPSARLTGEFSV